MRVAVIVFVIGEHYIQSFENKFKRNLETYCQKYGYDLIILDHLIIDDDPTNKKRFFWQRFLLPDKYKEYDYVVSIDSDIFINENSPSLPFDIIPSGKIAAINERKYMGNYEWREGIQVRFGNEKTGREYHALSGEIRDYHDVLNGGLVIYQPVYHADLMLELYHKNIDTYMKWHQDDQSILSVYLIDRDMIYWLDERFNRIWFYWRELFYPNFSELSDSDKRRFIKNFIELNYFTHFTSGIDIQYIDT